MECVVLEWLVGREGSFFRLKCVCLIRGMCFFVFFLFCRSVSVWVRCCIFFCRIFFIRKRVWGLRGRKSDFWDDCILVFSCGAFVFIFFFKLKFVYIFFNCDECKVIFIYVKLNFIFWFGLVQLEFFSCKLRFRLVIFGRVWFLFSEWQLGLEICFKERVLVMGFFREICLFFVVGV